MGEFERPLKGKKNGVFLFVISHLVPEIFKIFVLCKLGTDDVIRCDNSPLSHSGHVEFTSRILVTKTRLNV